MSIVSLPLASTLTNGNTADAGQVTTDLLQIATNVNSNAAANGVNSDITQLTALTSVTNNVTFSAGLTLPSATISNPTITGVANASGVTSFSINTPTFTGVVTGSGATSISVPTVATSDNSTNAASTAYVTAKAFSTALPSLVANKAITNDGTTVSWGVQGVLGGGTGQFGYTTGDILYASGATALSKLNAGTVAYALTSGGPGIAPVYAVLTAPGGGTGQASYTVGDILYASGTTTLSKLSAGGLGASIVSNGPGVAPSYAFVLPDFLVLSQGVF